MGKPTDDLVILVTEAAADALDRPPTELPHLTDAIDPEALKTLVSQPNVTVTFHYAGLDYIVVSDKIVFAQSSGNDIDTLRERIDLDD